MAGKNDVNRFLVSSLILFAISIAFHYFFLEIDFLIAPKAKWSTPAGYTRLQFAYLVLGTYFIPIAIIFMSLFISKSLQQIPDHGYFKLPMYVFLMFGFLAGCITSARYSWEVLGCIGTFCVGTSNATSTSSGSISVNMIFFSICLYFFLALAGATAITGLKKYRCQHLLPQPTYRQNPISNQTRLVNEKQNVKSDALSVNSMNDLRAAESRHRKERKHSLLKEMIMVALVFAVLYPILFVACMILPTWWSGFTKFKIQQYQAQVPPQSHGIYWAMTVKENVVLKLFPDILIYYGAIYFVSLLALVAQFWPPLKRFFHMRLTPTACVGQVLLGLTLVLLVGGSWLYWFTIHIYENDPKKARTNAELAARSFGQIGNIVIGLLVLPVAKNGVWSRVFGVSWEGMIIYHQILGYSFLLIILSHMFSWWVVYSQKGSFPSDIFAVPMMYHKDNFTVPLSVVTSFIMFVIMGGFTFHVIRRKNYELFYYLHFFSGIIFLSVLW
jgi:Ferric reductase like transmembrane component